MRVAELIEKTLQLPVHEKVIHMLSGLEFDFLILEVCWGWKDQLLLCLSVPLAAHNLSLFSLLLTPTQSKPELQLN